MAKDTVVILTALNLEYNAVRQHLVNPQVCWHQRGTRFETGTLRATKHRLALCLTGKGNQPAAVLAERAVQQFSPAAVIFVGVAGALWDATPLGDVVVATHVYAYHGGTSEDDGLKARPRVWETAHKIHQVASYLGRTAEWASHTPPDVSLPKVHFGAIAAGEIVQNSRISHEATWIRQHYNDALAIEMEAGGVAQAGHLSGAPVAIVRGISDRADGTKSTSQDGTWQPRAAANAAAFAVRLAAELIEEQEHPAMDDDNSGKSSGRIINIATGVVGIQGGHVTGNTVWVHTESSPSIPLDLASELASLRAHLAREHATGRLDDDTYDAAEAELDIASAAAETSTTNSKNTLAVALRRLRGLVADIADLAAKVVALISAIRGM